MNYGVIGSADGPTAILVAEQVGFDWINILGIIVVILMLIPNIIYAVKFRGQHDKCGNKAVKILEQIGRYGCMLLMVFNFGMPKFGFPSVGNFLVYLLGNGVLLLAYWIVWILFFIKPCKGKSMMLAVIPVCIFLLSGWMLEHWLLVIFALVFGVAHVYVTSQQD